MATTQTNTMMTEEMKKKIRQSVTITPPNFGYAVFPLIGTAPLVTHRFSHKVKMELLAKMQAGSTAASKKVRKPLDIDEIYRAAGYRHQDGWEGMPASAFRNAAISACRTVGFKMTLAKLSIFIEADGYDATEPQIPLVRIIGSSIRQEDVARVETGQPYVTVRPAFLDWKINLRVKWDQDQFTITDVTNLLARVGEQVGVGEGRPDSKHSAGMGWGLFRIEQTEEAKEAA